MPDLVRDRSGDQASPSLRNRALEGQAAQRHLLKKLGSFQMRAPLTQIMAIVVKVFLTDLIFGQRPGFLHRTDEVAVSRYSPC